MTNNDEALEPEKSELILYADNEGELYNQKKSIIDNVKRKIESGKYEPTLAPKLWQYWIDAAAKRYCKEFDCQVVRTFPLKVRQAAAAEVAKREYEMIKNGEYGQLKIKGAKAAKAKLPKVELVRLKLDRQGYVNGRYYGTGAPLFEATNPDTNITVTLRAPDRPTALVVVKRMFTEPNHKSVTDRFGSAEIRAFVGD